ncbi:phosphatase PAP2 family protein [Gordonia sp. ABSL1-1]|uniref:phosphatase PAP2 family protein n=1 Tax=Gordonia sp. ABSL1-1 TaxID=3053923 RepID=UPI0025732E42|nr:phosphatase PAP2 family protein [Gordonia sp. ABSL1-1]MDL9937695.1 phosphatase PAP2 family protein [Gordonia sp. ABSL1-1]
METKWKAWVLVYSVLVVGVIGVGFLVAGGPTGIDRAVMDAVAGVRGDGVTSVVLILTALFSPALVPVWAVALAVSMFAIDRRVQRGVAVLGSVVVASAVAEVIKLIVARPRPPALDQINGFEATLSYPSGHVTGTAALLVAVALVLTATAARAARVGALFAALAVTVLIACTRLYLGVHWLTDVSAGLVIGVGSAAMVVALTPSVVAAVEARVHGRIPPRAAQWLKAGSLSPLSKVGDE